MQLPRGGRSGRGGISLKPHPAENPNEPAATGISIAIQDRIRDLEQSLREERRACEDAEARYQELQRRYSELEQKLDTVTESDRGKVES